MYGNGRKGMIKCKNTVTMKTLPSGPKRFVCPVCEKDCGTNAPYLKKHVKTKHPDFNVKIKNDEPKYTIIITNIIS